MATATQTRKTPAKPKPKTATAARKPVQKTAAKPASKPAERGVRDLVVDSAYATIGLTDSAVAVLKTLPLKAAELREEAPVIVKTAPKQATERVQALAGQGKAVAAELRTQADQRLGTLAARGREVVGKVQNSAATKRALDQSRIARSQVKAAATSVRKAVGAGVQAAEVAADKVGVTA